MKVLESLDQRLGGLEKCTDCLAQTVGDLHKQSITSRKETTERLMSLEGTSHDVGRKLKLLQEKMVSNLTF